MPDARPVVVLAPNWLGDAVMALPAIADVKRHFSSSPLIVAARRAVASVFQLSPVVDDVVPLQWNGRLPTLRALRHDVDTLRRLAAGYSWVLPNSFASAWMVSRAGIPERMGYARDWRRAWLTRAVKPPRHSVHQAEYYQHLVRALDVPNGPQQAVLNAPPAAIEQARALIAGRGWDGSRPLVAIAPGAAYGTAKRWMPAHFARLATLLVDQHRATCVCVGSASDAQTTQWIRGMVAEEARAYTIDLAGETSLHALAGVMSLSRVFVSNDSGAMHMAAALGVPVVALFGPTREYETAPLARSGARADVLLHQVWCRPCMLRECPIDHRCMKGLAPERVLTTVSEMLR